MTILENRKILVVEDDEQEVVNLSSILSRLSCKYKVAVSMREALDSLNQEAFDFLLTDLHIETKAGIESPDGIEVISFAKEQQPNIITVANSSDPRTDIWNLALSSGAQHFIRKPVTKSDELIIAFNLAKERKTLLGKKKNGKVLTNVHYSQYISTYQDGIVLDKINMQRANGLARKHNIAAVILGETGTGKEEFARLVHKIRTRNEGQIPFVAVNCATISDGLAESLLFGHRKGSFTGAHETTSGYIAEADGGILFLDEIHTLNLKIQQKLLRALNDGSFNRLGETRIYTSKFQLICATTRDLDDEAEQGTFLLDLRGRISGIDIFLKPLRERTEDIPALVSIYLSKKDIFLNEHEFVLLCDRLKGYYWRTNIRQLFKVLDAWIIRCDFEELPLHPDHLPVFKGMLPPDVGPATKSQQVSIESTPKQGILKKLEDALKSDVDLDALISEIEREIITSSVNRHKTIGSAAESLHLPRSTFDLRRKKLGLL